MLHFLFPADSLQPREVDAHFSPLARCLESGGHGISVFDDDVLRSGATPRGIGRGATVVYRGWMLTPTEYAALTEGIHKAGAEPLTTPQAYVLTHHLPRWYPLLSEFTPETIVRADLNAALAVIRTLDWGEYFLKDFVKSLKVDGGSIVRTADEVQRWAESMLRYRDELEGGVCLRRVERFRPESETRWFVLKGVPYAPQTKDIPLAVSVAASRIASPFFSVDVAETEAGDVRIVELGDGQVSDLVGWSEQRFAAIWNGA